MDTLHKVRGECPFCHKEYSVIITDDVGYKGYRKGIGVNKCLPDLSKVDMEFLISGICPKCQKRVFK